MSGSVRQIDEINPIRTDVNHFWVLRSRNSILRIMIKNSDTKTNNIERIYARKIHHQGKVIVNRLDLFEEFSDACWIGVTFPGFASRRLIRRKNCTSNKLGKNVSKSTIIPIPI